MFIVHLLEKKLTNYMTTVPLIKGYRSNRQLLKPFTVANLHHQLFYKPYYNVVLPTDAVSQFL